MLTGGSGDGGASGDAAAVATTQEGGEDVRELDKDGLVAAEAKYSLLLVNYYAPWCPWSQRLAPVWSAVAKTIHTKYPPEGDGRVLLGQVDCTRHSDVCRDAQIQ